MKLIVGGYSQGKLSYVLLKYHLQKDLVWDGVMPDDRAVQKDMVILNHFHLWVRKRILDGGCPEEEILSFLDHCKECIIICDEIGNGIIPADPFEREYRERVGKILVQLAERAEEVERIICGIGQKIK